MTMVQEFQKKNRKEKQSFRKLFDAKDDIFDLFEKGTFPYKGNVIKTNKKQNQKKKSLKKIKDDYKKCFKYIEDESKGINYELFEKKSYMRQKIKRKTMSQ